MNSHFIVRIEQSLREIHELKSRLDKFEGDYLSLQQEVISNLFSDWLERIFSCRINDMKHN